MDKNEIEIKLEQNQRDLEKLQEEKERLEKELEESELKHGDLFEKIDWRGTIRKRVVLIKPDGKIGSVPSLNHLPIWVEKEHILEEHKNYGYKKIGNIFEN